MKYFSKVTLTFLIYFSVCNATLLNDLSAPEIQQLKSELKAEIIKELNIECSSKTTDGRKRLSTDTPIAFMAGLGHSIVNPPNGFHVVFDQVKINVGSAYNPRHGVFIAPVSGIYLFALNMASSPEAGHKKLHVNIMKAGTPIGYLFLDSNTQYFLRRSDMTIVYLNQGDDVYVEVFDVEGHSIIDGDYARYFNNHFSGFLIGRY